MGHLNYGSDVAPEGLQNLQLKFGLDLCKNLVIPPQQLCDEISFALGLLFFWFRQFIG